MPTFNIHFPAIAVLALLTLLAGCGSSGGSDGEASIIPEPLPATSAPSTSSSRKGAPITLHWPIPQLREDGSILAIDEIAGYELTYKNSRREVEVVTIDDPLATSYLIEYLPADNYEFAVFAFDKQNTLSESSPLAKLSVSDFPLE